MKIHQDAVQILVSYDKCLANFCKRLHSSITFGCILMQGSYIEVGQQLIAIYAWPVESMWLSRININVTLGSVKPCVLCTVNVKGKLGTWCCKEIRHVARYPAVCYSIFDTKCYLNRNVSFIFVKVSNNPYPFQAKVKKLLLHLVVYVLEVSLSWLWSRTVLFHSDVGHHWCSQVPHKSYISHSSTDNELFMIRFIWSAVCL